MELINGFPNKTEMNAHVGKVTRRFVEAVKARLPKQSVYAFCRDESTDSKVAAAFLIGMRDWLYSDEELDEMFDDDEENEDYCRARARSYLAEALAARPVRIEV